MTRSLSATTQAKRFHGPLLSVSPTVLMVSAVLLLFLAVSPVAASVPASYHAYGHMRLVGLPYPFEYFRGTFGEAIPCGARPVVLAPGNGSHGRTACDASVWDGVDLTGAIAVVDRGVCPFGDKAAALAGTGVAGMVLVNSETGLMRMPRAASSSAQSVDIDFAVVMTRNFTRPMLVQAWTMAQAQGLPLTGSLEPTKLPCKEAAVPHPPSVAVAVSVSPTGSVTSEAEVDPFSPDGVGFPKHVALTKTAQLTFTGATDPDVPTQPVEVFASRFGGVMLPGLSAPLSFPEPFHGCDPFDEPEAVAGTIAVVDRGVCAMVDKARFAQDAGAVAVVFVNLGADPVAPGEGPELEGFFGENVGAVVSYGDDREPMVRIPAMMVSREVAGEWRAMPDAFDGATATLTPTAGSGDGWTTLMALRDATPKEWSADTPAHVRTAAFRSLVTAHHPDSRQGSEERFAFLTKVAARAGVGADLAAAVESMDTWYTAADAAAAAAAAANADQEDVDAGTTALLAKNLDGLVGGTPTHAFLTRKMSALALEMRDTSVMDCHTSSGHFSMGIPKFAADSKFATIGRIQELFRLQACLERLSLHVSAVLGDALKKAKVFTNPTQHHSTMARLLAPFGLSKEDVQDDMAKLMAIAKLYDGVVGMPMSVADALEASAADVAGGA